MRYITTNASNRLPVEVQLLMWHLRDDKYYCPSVYHMHSENKEVLL